MTLELLHQKNFKSTKSRFSLAKMSVSIKGIFRISAGGIKLLGLKQDDHVQFVYDSVKEIFYVGQDLNKKPGFKIRMMSSSALFNSKSFSRHLALKMDLALVPDKLKIVTLDIDPADFIEYNGSKLYKLY